MTVFVQNGDNLISLTKGIILTDEESEQFKKDCGYYPSNLDTNLSKYEACYRKKVTSDAIVIRANKTVQELITQFKLK